jgi:hypothetical protein
MQPEKPVEIDRARRIRRAADARRRGNRQLRPRRVVIPVAERHQHVECVGRAALKEHDQRLTARRPRQVHRQGGAPQETRRQPKGDQR